MISWWRRQRLLRQAGMVTPAGERMWALLEPVVGSRRRGGDLVMGLPAVSAFLGVVAVTAVAHLRQTDTAHGYWAAATQRLQSGDALAAQLLLQKALSVEADEHESLSMRLTLALAYEQSGDRQRADALMRSLATTDSVGQPAAHRYMAIRIADQVSRKMSGGAEPVPGSGSPAAGGRESVAQAGLESPLTPKANRAIHDGDEGANIATSFTGEGARHGQKPEASPDNPGLPEALLAEWHWHLSHAENGRETQGQSPAESDRSSADLQRAWAVYCMLTGELRKAAEHLRAAAEVQPALWLQVAALEARSGEADAGQVHATLTTARQRFKAAFIADPADDHRRLLYAASLYYLDELAEAEELLEEGIARSNDPGFRRLLAAVFVRRYDRRAAELAAEAGPAEAAEDLRGAAAGERWKDSEGIEISESTGAQRRGRDEEAPRAEGGEGAEGGEEGAPIRRAGVAVGDAVAFAHLRRALALDPQCEMALQRLLALSHASPEAVEKGRELMRRLIPAGEGSAMAHFTLGALEWLAGDGEQATLHMQQAMALDGKLPVVANNLAFLVAEGPAGNLEVALALACQAVDADPTHPSFLDTRGRIHERRGDLSAAAVDYQRALERSAHPQRLQQRLAEIYEKLGDTALAAQYREASQSL